MRGRWVLVLAVCVVGSVAGCGDDASTSSTAAATSSSAAATSTSDPAASTPDPADATSCVHLADKYVEITGAIIDQIGDRTDAEMETPSAEIEAAADDWFQMSSQLIPRIAELCGEGEFDELLCERRSAIEPAGEAGERFLRDNYPSCTIEPPEVTTLPSGG